MSLGKGHWGAVRFPPPLPIFPAEKKEVLPPIRVAYPACTYLNDDSCRGHDKYDCCRDSVERIGLPTIYNNAGTAKIPARRTRLHELWVGLWVGKSTAPGPALLTSVAVRVRASRHQIVVASRHHNTTPLRCCSVIVIQHLAIVTLRWRCITPSQCHNITKA
jgi:hypothetical protein